MKINLVSVFLFAAVGAFVGRARSEPPPALLVPAEAEKLAGKREMLAAPYPGLLFVPGEAAGDSDGKYHQPYHTVCAAYSAEKLDGAIVRYVLRFLVHAPDADSAPLAQRTARFLMLLHGENGERLRLEHPRATPFVEVWLSGQAGAGLEADIGGEQFRNQIYLYRIFTERSPAEWAREVAHEYGHFALPGVTGFMEPEAWANGVLGERLFLKWLQEDWMNQRLESADIPFVTPTQLTAYNEKKIAPALQREARNGPDAALRQTDSVGMEALVGLALYCDSVYGSKGLRDAFAYTESSRGDNFLRAPDFLRGIQAALQSATEFTIAPPGQSLTQNRTERETFAFFLPKGVWSVTQEGPLKRWELAAKTKGVVSPSPSALTVTMAGWRQITLVRNPAGGAAVHLKFKRRDAG